MNKYDDFEKKITDYTNSMLNTLNTEVHTWEDIKDFVISCLDACVTANQPSVRAISAMWVKCFLVRSTKEQRPSIPELKVLIEKDWRNELLPKVIEGKKQAVDIMNEVLAAVAQANKDKEDPTIN